MRFWSYSPRFTTIRATGAPITYMAGGKQFIVFPVGGGPVTEELIAVAL